MGIDIRLPIGLMFAVFGVMMTVYGMLSNPAIYARSLGVNVNLIWGVVLLMFGGVMLALGWRGHRTGIQKHHVES
jgi:putative Mn2+ efflux pump MntP